MGRIQDQAKYPLKATPNNTDYVVGSDSQALGLTVNFTVSSLVAKTITDLIPVSATVSGIINNTALQELGGVDKLINGLRIGKGTGTLNSANTAFGINVLGVNAAGDGNTGVGYEVLKFNTNGYENTAMGVSAMRNNTTGENNSAFGSNAMFTNTVGFANVAVGDEAFYANLSGGRNTVIGSGAGRYSTASFDAITIGYNAGARISGDVITATSINESIMIGGLSKPLANAQTNQIVIGYNATGAGSNTATLGNTSITKTILQGVVSTAKTYTVATLPAGVLGDRTIVIDATTPTYLGTLTGGGAVKCPVFYNGTAWVSH